MCVCVFVSVQFNPLLRDIFGLGAPLILDPTVKVNKISRFEKVTASILLLNLNLPIRTIQLYVLLPFYASVPATASVCVVCTFVHT